MAGPSTPPASGPYLQPLYGPFQQSVANYYDSVNAYNGLGRAPRKRRRRK